METTKDNPEIKKVKKTARKKPLPQYPMEQKRLALRPINKRHLTLHRFTMSLVHTVEYVLKSGQRISTLFEGELLPHGRVEVENKTYHNSPPDGQELLLVYPSSVFHLGHVDIVILYNEEGQALYTIEY